MNVTTGDMTYVAAETSLFILFIICTGLYSISEQHCTQYHSKKTLELYKLKRTVGAGIIIKG